jgi:polyisoprenyl-phosphate glycosyltransferase
MQINEREKLLNERRIKISCIVPAHNEEENIQPFVAALSKEIEKQTDHYEIIIVDDGSRDKTVQQVESHLLSEHVKLLVFSRNFGKEKALTAGIEHCSGDVAILIDADFQHPLETIPVFLEHWKKGDDMVYGIRNTRRSETWLKRKFTRLFYRLIRGMGEVKIPRDAGDFRLLDRCVIEALKQCPERNRFMKGLYAWVGFKSSAVVYQVKKRAAGTSSWHFMKLTNLALTGITSFSNLPLRIWGAIGVVVSSISFLCALFIITDTLIFGEDVPGYATLLVVVVFFGGLQILSIGILGEYISRIFLEAKQRPQYLIAKKRGFEPVSSDK